MCVPAGCIRSVCAVCVNCSRAPASHNVGCCRLFSRATRTNTGPIGTPYEGGSFRCKLVLGSEYPSAPPKGACAAALRARARARVCTFSPRRLPQRLTPRCRLRARFGVCAAYFLTKIFHPNVSSNGDVCVNTLKKDWKSNLGITHIYQVIRCLLIVPFPESALNEEASKLFLESYDDYAKRAVLMTSIHASHKYAGSCASSDDPSADPASTDSAHSSTAAVAIKAKRRAVAKGKKDARKRSLKRL